MYQTIMGNNFIKDFLENELQKKDKLINAENIEKNNFNTEKIKKDKEILKKVIQINNLEIDDIIINNDIEKEKIINNKEIDKTDSQIEEIENITKKEITGYLDNDKNLDKSLLQMDNNKELENIKNEMKEGIDTNVKGVKEMGNKKVKFKKNKGNKNLYWIITEFIIGIILIFISVSHINNNVAEFKFIKSSVQLWSNTFQNIVNKIGGIFSDDVQKNYIQKRMNMIEQLSDLSKKVNKGCDINDYKELNYKIESFKASLINTNFTPLSKFIKNYDQYSLYLYSLQELVNKKCNKNNLKDNK